MEIKEENKIFETMEKDILKSKLTDMEKNNFLKNILNLKKKKINVMITGSTGCGKSSTINALFETDIAKVGIGVDPETIDIKKYELGNLILWDTPGLGDGKKADNRHSKNIIDKLLEKDEEGNALIDLVLVILDGGSRDLGTSYELINNVIIPNLKKSEKRILIAINQADVAMKGRYWDSKENKPEKKLKDFLDEKVLSVQKRIKEGTGIEVTPIYYSAGFKEADESQNPYNLSKLLYYILKYTPKEKRIVYFDNISKDKEIWKDNDELSDYNSKIKSSFAEAIVEGVTNGAEIGESLGGIFGETGKKIGQLAGGIVGGITGTIRGAASAVFSRFGW